MTRISIALPALLLPLAALTAAPAAAEPSDCFNPQMCADPGQVIYCPDTGGYVTAFSGSCPSLSVGPYLPGGLSPDTFRDSES
ncbi:hypothetical protein [Mycobacterium shimoidei]|uniref:hypothetical protein n=1 Tax=Mycobacterium shimoidei TaxID=29313 RepID=UPI000848DCE4|nr:hypothetical protein [Mycobacterium shimoidei]MCV7260537.1 hypothetical protein [Mycobacterium shimoidei]ODR12466.1 hypothetical protein BHQ16_15010 [Mycobacterium shimoidei]ORW80869.1 hypothetical protein AWC26_10425 [Mycobacterium shimoidei]